MNVPLSSAYKRMLINVMGYGIYCVWVGAGVRQVWVDLFLPGAIPFLKMFPHCRFAFECYL